MALFVAATAVAESLPVTFGGNLRQEGGAFMLERKDVLSIPYLKKTTFTGSYEGLRFRFSLIKKEPLAEDGAGLGKETEQLEVIAWEGPYCFGVTPEEQMQRLETEFSEEGIQQGIDWLNGLWAVEPEKWKAAKGNWGKRP